MPFNNEPITLETELENIIEYIRNPGLGEKAHEEASRCLQLFSIGLLCGLKEAKGGANYRALRKAEMALNCAAEQMQANEQPKWSDRADCVEKCSGLADAANHSVLANLTK